MESQKSDMENFNQGVSMRYYFCAICSLALVLQTIHVHAGFWDAIDSARKSVGSAIGGCSWKYPNGKRCGARTVSGSSYCKDHKCVKCNERICSNIYCQRHDPKSHVMCIWPSCGEPGEIRFRHKGGRFFVNGQEIPSKSGDYCKLHYAQVTAKLVEVGCIDFFPEVYERFDDSTKKKIDAALAKRSAENAKRRQEELETRKRAKLAEKERLRRQEEKSRRAEADRQYLAMQEKQRVEKAEAEARAAKEKAEAEAKAKEEKTIVDALANPQNETWSEVYQCLSQNSKRTESWKKRTYEAMKGRPVAWEGKVVDVVQETRNTKTHGEIMTAASQEQRMQEIMGLPDLHKESFSELYEKCKKRSIVTVTSLVVDMGPTDVAVKVRLSGEELRFAEELSKGDSVVFYGVISNCEKSDSMTLTFAILNNGHIKR